MSIELGVRVDWSPDDDGFTVKGLGEPLKGENDKYTAYSIIDPPILIHVWWFPYLPSDEERDQMQYTIIMYCLGQLEKDGLIERIQ